MVKKDLQIDFSKIPKYQHHKQPFRINKREMLALKEYNMNKTFSNHIIKEILHKLAKI